MTYAGLADVELDLGEQIELEDMDKVTVLLERAEARLRMPDAFPDLDGQVAAGAMPEVLVKQVECEMVCSVLRNPNCYQSESETIGSKTTSVTINVAVASGLLRLTTDQRILLGGAADAAGTPVGAAGAFTINGTSTPRHRARRSP